jgi:repressor LexA
LKPLTARQGEILEFVQLYARENSRPPNFSEIGEHFAIQPSAARFHVMAIAKKGFLRHTERGGPNRTIQLIPRAS